MNSFDQLTIVIQIVNTILGIPGDSPPSFGIPFPLAQVNNLY